MTFSGKFASAVTHAGALAMYGICFNCSVSDFHSEMKTKTNSSLCTLHGLAWLPSFPNGFPPCVEYRSIELKEKCKFDAVEIRNNARRFDNAAFIRTKLHQHLIFVLMKAALPKRLGLFLVSTALNRDFSQSSIFFYGAQKHICFHYCSIESTHL